MHFRAFWDHAHQGRFPIYAVRTGPKETVNDTLLNFRCRFGWLKILLHSIIRSRIMAILSIWQLNLFQTGQNLPKCLREIIRLRVPDLVCVRFIVQTPGR